MVFGIDNTPECGVWAEGHRTEGGAGWHGRRSAGPVIGLMDALCGSEQIAEDLFHGGLAG